MIQILRFYLLRAQHQMKVMADRNRYERDFSMGYWLRLKLQPYRQGIFQF